MFKCTVIILAIINTLAKFSIILRESFIAAICGTSIIGDMLHISFRILSLLRKMMGENNITQIILSILATKEGVTRIKFVNNATSSLLLIGMLFISIFLFFTPTILHLFPGIIDPEHQMQLILIIRIHILYFFFIIIGASFIALLNYYEKFIYFALMPIVYNIGIVIFSWVLSYLISFEIAIVVGAVLSGLIQVIIIVSALHIINSKVCLVIPRINWDIILLFKKLMPDISAGLIVQLGTLFYYGLYSQIIGAISIMSYAMRVWQIPFAIIINGLNIMLFSKLSKIKQLTEYTQMQNKTINVILIFSIPLTCFCIAIAHPLIELIYFQGQFSLEDVEKVTNIFSLGVLALPAMMLNKIYKSFFYLKYDTKIPAMIAVFIVCFDIIFVYYTLDYMGYTGLVYTILLHQYIMLFLFHYIGNKKQYLYFTYQFTYLLKLVFCSLIMAIAAYYLQMQWLNIIDSKLYTLFILICITCISIGIYIFALLMNQIITWQSIKNYYHH